LDWILRGQNEKRFLQDMADAAGGDLVLLHGFEQSCLSLGGRSVDFVGEDHVGKHWPANKKHPAALAGILEDLSAGDIRRHEVGGELDALEFEMENLRNGF